jgi:(S)-ureidoglycine aminohydrolase
MSTPYGTTRTRIAARHALLAPDGHVKSSVPGITGAATVILISEAMGAKFSQLLVTFESGGDASFPANEVETVGYVISGGGTVVIGDRRGRCAAGGFFFAPAGTAWSFSGPKRGTQVTLFKKRYAFLPGVRGPKAVIGVSSRIKSEPFLGDPNARLQVLLPDAPAYDLAVNIFTYQPGATLPFVETHIMEHGLLMLSGQGVYRLEDSWYPVGAGDVIWMAPYCPQWFVAMGKQPASYLYYKDVNRPAL